MTVLFFARLFYPHVGGVEKHILEISKRLIEKGNNVIVVAEKHDPNLKEEQSVNGIKIFRINIGKSNWFKKFRIWFWLLKNINLIKKVDIIHAHDVFFWYLPFRFLFPKKKVFTTFHGYENFPISKKAILVHKISEILSFGNICIGDFIKKWYGTKPTFVSYGGVNMDNVKCQLSNVKCQLSAVFVGRLDEQTGILTYIEAVKKIKERIPNFKFTVFGDGKLKNKLPDFVDFRGFVKDAEKEIIKYDFVFVSRYLSILEAIAAKKIVVAAYNNPLKRDYLRLAPFSSFIFICKNSQEIVENVRLALKNPLSHNTMLFKGFEWVKKQTWENVTNVYLKLWQKD